MVTYLIAKKRDSVAVIVVSGVYPQEHDLSTSKLQDS